ncbi:MAG: hypothetical protein HXS48_23435 [Theionarchaea archaeon]|nr:hypothetical protein [Theionarchaea archaeon]
MGKVRDHSIHLQLGHLLNKYPQASVDKIYKITRKDNWVYQYALEHLRVHGRK